MPTYEYQCQCGVQFEARASIADREQTKPCPACPEQGKPIPPSGVHGHFKKEVTGPVPQNTGIHDLDTKIDRVIGQSSHQGWEVAEGRKRMKQEVMHREGVTGHDLSKNLDGSYRVLKPEERGLHERSQAIHQAAGERKKPKG
jgi:putative FmdB family regulatory protein